MLTIEIAGHTLAYRNAPELNEKVRTLLSELRETARSAQKHFKSLREQERTLLRFLGEAKARKESGEQKQRTTHVQEVNQNA